MFTVRMFGFAHFLTLNRRNLKRLPAASFPNVLAGGNDGDSSATGAKGWWKARATLPPTQGAAVLQSAARERCAARGEGGTRMGTG